MSLLHTEIRDRTLRATLNRPGSRNAVNFAVMEELESIIGRLESDTSLRVLILEGEGSDAFISGGDLREFHTLETAGEARRMAARMHRLLLRLEGLPCWTIACVNGPAWGGGCEIMLAFDFRLAAEKATFGFTQAKFYLPPGWGGLTRLVERVGRSTALRWLAEAAVVGVPEALEKGLIDRAEGAETLRETAWGWAEQLARNDRNFIGALKEGAFREWEGRRASMRAELEGFGEFWEDEKHRRRVQQFLDRREES